MFVVNEATNLMEALVAEEFDAVQVSQRYDHHYVQDLYCLTMNALQPRYVRFVEEARKALTTEERSLLSASIQQAIHDAHALLATERRRLHRQAL
ncbi:Late competence development protein ComFB [Spongiibacter sp. IMCC21906]|uniref:late competence development ComFB family protein n=1 Tax=Spongiibacter sp. IMCC21906 TaxID=1620392 RepID=UPI00062DF77C|nr:late competence development ComFB family protein [Spongiibacter sp. IMCC21906]AKH69156.1 Late competence development protein ComFB [Spongiibacter sp. IMCC21906]